MSEHPEYPQESPAMKYVIEQVSKIEDASTCATGYYKSLAKIISRLDKTDVELNKLHMVVTDLKKITDSDTIANAIGARSNDMVTELHDGIARTCDELETILNSRLGKMETVHTGMISQVNSTNDRSKRIEDDLHVKLTVLMKDMEKLVSEVRARTAPPLQTIVFYMCIIMALSFTMGLLFGKYIV